MAKTDFVKKTEELLAPARALNELTLANAERMMDLQLANARKYTGLVLEGLREAAAVKDAEGAKNFLLNRVEVARSTSETLRGDTEELVKLGQAYVTEVQGIVKSSLDSLPKALA